MILSIIQLILNIKKNPDGMINPVSNTIARTGELVDSTTLRSLVHSLSYAESSC